MSVRNSSVLAPDNDPLTGVGRSRFLESAGDKDGPTSVRQRPGLKATFAIGDRPIETSILQLLLSAV